MENDQLIGQIRILQTRVPMMFWVVNAKANATYYYLITSPVVLNIDILANSDGC